MCSSSAPNIAPCWMLRACSSNSLLSSMRSIRRNRRASTSVKISKRAGLSQLVILTLLNEHSGTCSGQEGVTCVDQISTFRGRVCSFHRTKAGRSVSPASSMRKSRQGCTYVPARWSDVANEPSSLSNTCFVASKACSAASIISESSSVVICRDCNSASIRCASADSGPPSCMFCVKISTVRIGRCLTIALTSDKTCADCSTLDAASSYCRKAMWTSAAAQATLADQYGEPVTSAKFFASLTKFKASLAEPRKSKSPAS